MGELDEVTKRLQDNVTDGYIKREKVVDNSLNTKNSILDNQPSPEPKSNISNRLPKIHIRMFHEFTYDPNTDTRVDIRGPFMNVVAPGRTFNKGRGKKASKGVETKIVEDEVI